MGLSGASGLSAAISDTLRLAIGASSGANNLTGEQIIDEAKWIGMLSSGGTAVVTTAARVVPYLIEVVGGKQVPPSFYRGLEEAQKRTAKSAKGESLQTPGMYSEEISMKEIYEFVDDMGREMGENFKMDYNPSLSARAQSPRVAAMEKVFLEMSENYEGAQALQLIKEGNEEVINRLFRGMQDALGDDILTDVTAAELGQATRGEVSRQSEQLITDARVALDNSLKMINAGDNATETIAVQSLLDEVPMVGRTTKMMPRSITRLDEIKNQYLEPYTKAYDEAINSPKYAAETTVTSGAGYTRSAMDRWVNINKKTADRLFKRGGIESAAARQELEEIITNKNTIIRLRGREPVTKQVEVSPATATQPAQYAEIIVAGKFKKPNFTLKELDEARVDLNKFASDPKTTQTAKELARELERGLENQMYATVRAMGAEKSGLSGKALTKWMDTPGSDGIKYGKEIIDAWVARSKALANANSDFYLSLAAQPAEKIVNAFLNTNVRGAINTKIAPVIEMLETTGSKELGDVRRAMAQHIKNNVVGSGEKSALQEAKAYRDFWAENKGTLEVIYGKDVYGKFPKLKDFQKNVVKPLEEAQQASDLLRRLFNVENPRATTGNIIADVLESGSINRSSGEALLNQQRIIEIIKNSPELSKNMGAVAQSWLVRKVIKPDPAMPGKYSLDLDEFTRILYDDFSTAGTSGPKLNFEEFFAPFLGKSKIVKGKTVWNDARGRKYVSNLKKIHAMLEREAGIPLTNPGMKGWIKEIIAAVLPKTARIRRGFMPVLSVAGRRARITEEVVGERSSAAFGEILLNDQALDATINYLMGKYKTEQFLRVLTSYGIIHLEDIGNEEKLYSTTTKQFSEPAFDYNIDNLRNLFSETGENN